WDAEGVQLAATREGSDFVLNGTKLFVPDAHVTDQMVVAARTSQGKTPEEGVTLFLVDSKSPGISIELLKTIAGDKQCEVAFANVKVPASGVLGPVDQGWPIADKTRKVATVATCAYLVGLSQMDFDITVNYTKERVQFGRPIGSFQALQHRMADSAIDVDSSRFITYKAAWSLQEGEPDADIAVSMAKAWVSDASRRVAREGQQLHGGISFTQEYKIQLYFRRQKWMELMWGDGDYHRELVAQKLNL
ncbi:MAG: acyl-CoA dehydrogenase, partial [Dehalococcoidia bacterium]